MKGFFETLRNIWNIEELRNRILLTIGLLLVFRLGSFVVLPGVDAIALSSRESGGLTQFIDLFLGGAFSRASIFALGIMPYISASIIMQLATMTIGSLQKMQKEGESGRKKITQITRYLTIAVTFVQGIAYINGTIGAEYVSGISYPFFVVTSIIILTSGTMFCMWLGEKITDRGIGNGISMLIMIGIISRLPGAIVEEFTSTGDVGSAVLLMILKLGALFVIVMATVLLIQATRRVPVQYAKQVVGGKTYGGQRNFIPLKVNIAGVMPIIFAQALMYIPAMLAGLWGQDSSTASGIGQAFSSPYTWQYTVVFGLLIIAFTYMYTAIIVNSRDISDNLKRSGGFIPGVKPGQDTENYIDAIIDRITFPGAIALGFIAIIPTFAYLAGVGELFSSFYGGTSLLIMVGVIIDTLQQIESYLIMRHYDGMMKSGRMRGRTENAAVA